MLKQRILDLFSHQKSKELSLFILVLIEGVSPVPADILLVTLVKKNKEHWKRYLIVITLGFLLSSSIFYFLGGFLAERFLNNLLTEYHLIEDFNDALIRFNNYGAGIIAFLAMLPFPFKISCIAAGSLKAPFSFFLFYSFVGRCLRYIFQIILIHNLSKVPRIDARQYIYFIGGLIFSRKWLQNTIKSQND